MTTLILGLAFITIMLFIILLLVKAFKSKVSIDDVASSEVAEKKKHFKPSFINTTKLPKCKQVDNADFYSEFISKTAYNEQVKNKKCNDIFSF